MKILICGAGQVGFYIASYLCRESNDITVIDKDEKLITYMNNELDVKAVLGHASSPEVLHQAGAEEADIILAVTHSDEVNMIACQIAHTLFSVPKKIARIRNQDYLMGEWSNLFSRTHMPIDVIISPELEVAKSILQRLSVPGTTNIFELSNKKVFLTGVVCHEDCPIIHTQMKQIETLFPNLLLSVGMVIRGEELIIPDENEQILAGDEVYFFTDTEHLHRALAAFGHEEERASNIAIMGGGNIGESVAKLILDAKPRTNLKMIETSQQRAVELSQTFPSVNVFHGDGIEHGALEKLNISEIETFIAVTNDDETNILASVLAKQKGCERVITLVNNPNYNSILVSLGIDATVSPRSSTASKIMQHVRRGRIKDFMTIRDGEIEILEGEVSESSTLLNQKIEDIDLPPETILAMVVRGKEAIKPYPNFKIKDKDRVIILAKSGHIQKVEQLFTVSVELF